MSKKETTDFVYYTLWAKKLSDQAKALNEEAQELRKSPKGPEDLIKIGRLEARRDLLYVQLSDALEKAESHKDDHKVRVKFK